MAFLLKLSSSKLMVVGVVVCGSGGDVGDDVGGRW